jgi:hypothetical protein
MHILMTLHDEDPQNNPANRGPRTAILEPCQPAKPLNGMMSLVIGWEGRGAPIIVLCGNGWHASMLGAPAIFSGSFAVWA